MWWPFPQQVFTKTLIFTVFCCLRSPRKIVVYENYAVKEQLQNYYCWTSQQWNCHLMFTSFPCLRMTKWSLAKDICICLNHQELWSWLASLSAGSRRWNLYQVLFYVHRPGTHDQMMCVIFPFLDQFQISDKVQFWNSSYLETLIRFCMEMLKFSKFDLEWTTTKSTIIVYISLDFLRWQTLPFAAIEQTPHRIVLFW